MIWTKYGLIAYFFIWLARRSNEVIAFAATLKTNVQVEQYGVLKFDKERINIGYGFDLATGIFTAPKTGVYAFFASVVTKDNSLDLCMHFSLLLWRKITRSEAKLHCTPGHWTTGSLNAVVKLQAGHTVHLTNPEKAENGWVEGNEFAQFSGYILWNELQWS